MPKLVLVRFDNDATADQFIKKFHSASKRKPFRVLGVFKIPTEYCSCGPIAGTRYTEELARGPKTGWFIHLKCGLPRKGSLTPRNIWPDILNRANQKKTLAGTMVESWTLSTVDDEPRPNYPLTGPTNGSEG